MGKRRRRQGEDISMPPRVFPRDTDLVGAFYTKQLTIEGPVWHATGTYIRELSRLGYPLEKDRQERAMQRADGLQYLQSPRNDGDPKSRKSSCRPQPDLQDADSKLKYFLVLDGIDDDDIERGAMPMLAKCDSLNILISEDEEEGAVVVVVALWAVSRVMLVAASRKSEPPDLCRCPEPGQVLRFEKQSRRSACMADAPASPLHGLDLSQGEVVDISPGDPRAVACVFVRFRARFIS